MNYFSARTAAERYSNGRPDFHSEAIRKIKNRLGLRRKFDRALDIACGTGLSTKALLEIATEVYGTDASQEMVNLAACKERIKYAVAPAEDQPFSDSSFDLITVCSGVHWFEIDKFLSEANRLLKSKAWLVLYENYFTAEMAGKNNLRHWFSDVYLRKYPSPPRDNVYSWTNENLNRWNFMIVKEESFKNAVVLNKKQLTLYFTTQSNVISAAEKGETTYEQVESWLDKELGLFYDEDDSARTIYYGNWIKYIQRAS